MSRTHAGRGASIRRQWRPSSRPPRSPPSLGPGRSRRRRRRRRPPLRARDRQPGASCISATWPSFSTPTGSTSSKDSGAVSSATGTPTSTRASPSSIRRSPIRSTSCRRCGRTVRSISSCSPFTSRSPPPLSSSWPAASGLAPAAAGRRGVVYALGGFVLSTLNLYVYVQAGGLGAPRRARPPRSAAVAAMSRRSPWPRRLTGVAVSTLGIEVALQAVLVGLVLAVRPRRPTSLPGPVAAAGLGGGSGRPGDPGHAREHGRGRAGARLHHRRRPQPVRAPVHAAPGRGREPVRRSRALAGPMVGIELLRPRVPVHLEPVPRAPPSSPWPSPGDCTIGAVRAGSSSWHRRRRS